MLVANISESSICCSNFRMLCQPPVLSTISIATFVTALLVAADLVEYGVKIVISMPASSNTDFIHLAKSFFESWPIRF